MFRNVVLAIAVVFLSSAVVAQNALNNESVIKLVKAGLTDDLILSTINASPGTYDTSADGLATLKSSGVSDKVVAALVARALHNAPAVPTPDSLSGPAVAEHVAPAPLTYTASDVQSGGQPKIFVKADQDFAVALTAALNKKRAGATVVLNQQDAEYILQSAGVAAKQESGASKIARCLFAYCAGIEGSSSVSVQLVQVSNSSVVWAYQVRKGNGGPVGIQSLSEAVAKHLKNEFLDRKK